MSLFFYMLQINAVSVDTADTNMLTDTENTLSVLNLIMKGGWIMVPLIILSLIAVYIFIERFFAINTAAKEDTNFMNNIRDFIHDGKVDAAEALCKSTHSPISNMILKGITRIGKPLQDISAAIENAGKLEVYQLENNLTALATISGAAPMIGFLGTVMGMIKAFYNMANAGSIDITILSEGIYQAMITTVAGLIVGIVAYIAYNILVARVEKVIYKMEARSIEFIDLLHEPAK